MNAESLKNQDTPRVAVLMSTYNGEKYIREQLDSIFNQKDVSIMLFVRDDGSSDNTVAILREYEKNNPMTIIEDGENVGPGESFMRLLYQYYSFPNIDFFAFADQDDIWMNDKLKKATERILNSNYSGPILYGSNQTLYINGKPCGLRYDKPQPTELIQLITKNTISGCTFVMNYELAKLVSESEHADYRILRYRLHDSWVMLIAILCGHVIYDEESHILYRIHSKNAVGIKTISIKKRLGRLQRFFVQRDDSNLRMITAQQLLRAFPQITIENRKVLSLFADYQKSWEDKCSLAFNREIRKHTTELPFVFKIKVFSNFV